MEQSRIRELLAEASGTGCSDKRLVGIQAELGRETAAMGPNGVFDAYSAASGLLLVVDHLFTSAVREGRRDALPGLFPAFALLCGDREAGSLVADIDWSEVEHSNPSS